VHVHEVHEVKELVHNLASAITKCAARLKNRMDFECEKDGKEHEHIIHCFAEICEDYNHICETLRNLCDHYDKDGKRELHVGGISSLRR